MLFTYSGIGMLFGADSVILQQSVVTVQALNSSQAVTTAATYTENTIEVLLTMLTVLAISIQIARTYFLRILKKFTLRVAADVWWLIFIILRDASIFLVVFLGVMLFWPGIYQDFPIAVPFAPLAIDFFALALLIMLIKDTDEEAFWNSIVTIAVVIGSVLYIVGVVFVTESAVQLAKLPPTVSTATSNIWGYFYATFNSQANPALSIYSFYICFGLLMLMGLIAILSSFKGGIFNRFIEPKPQPVVKEVQPPQQPQQGQQKPG